ncbi:MAG: N-acetyl-alpha-D-glucosaminyl L-malate synthase BshA [Candidatus Eremiobacteraeota bacterium]|nr:N-acetyl-alpha-D-glucosaminyl L-malate synthase BshA [Candidatus Eremiobacteraeota bacterium]
MKIGITCYPGVGGSGILATELGITLAGRGHEIHFITSSPPIRLTMDFYDNIYFHEAEVINYPVFKYPPYSLCLAVKMAEVVEKFKLDILHVHYAVPHAASAYLAKKMCRNCNLKIVTTLHGTDVTLVGSQPGYLPLARFSINESDGVTAVSKHLEEVTRSLFGITRDIRVIYNFVDTTKFKPGILTDRRRKFADDNEKILIHMSNFRPVKKILNTIRVFEKIQREIPAVLLMVGDGIQRYEAGQLVGEMNLQNRVKFLGKIESVEHILPIADLFIINSVKESFGLAVLEAAACGVPAVVTDIGGLPEVVINGETGFVTPAEDTSAMAKMAVEILKNNELYNKMKINARKRAVEKFDTNLIVPEYERYYEKVRMMKNRGI